MAKASKPKVADAAEAAQDEKPKAGQSFKVGEKSFKFSLAKFIIPGLGERTSLEASTDDTKYDELGEHTICEYLVSIGSGVIEEA